MKKANPRRMLLSSAPVAQMQVAAAWYISHHRPPAISRKIGSVRRAGGGSGAERRSRNSVRARSYALGNGAPVAVWPRARTRVASPAVPTPHEYPGEGASSPVHESTVRVFRSREGPGPRRARCPRAGRRALVVVRGAAAAGRALRASPRPVAAASRPRRGRCAVGGRMRERAFQHHRAVAAARAARAARAHRVVVGGRMRWRRCAGVRGRGRAGPPAPAPPTRCRRSRSRQPHALGTSAGVRGHGAAGRAGGTAPTARSQTPPFHIGMGTAEVAGDGGAASRDGGARDARAVRRRGRAPRPAAQHTAARRRVRTGRASTVTSPLSASRADEKQLSASTEQVRERRARVGGRRGGGRRAARRQEGRAAAEGDALVGAHGRAARAARPAALRHGAAPPGRRAAARRVTSPRQPRRDHITLTFHYRDGRTRRSARASRSIIDLVFIYSGACRRGPPRVRAAPPGEPVFLAPSKSFAKTKTEIK